MPDVPPAEPEDARPWEAPGAVRRDVAPHRGNWLRALGSLALAFSLLAVLITAVDLWGCIGGWFAPDSGYGRTALGWWFFARRAWWLTVGIAWGLALVGALVGVLACQMAREDARRMRQGLMDPAGLSLVGRAASWGRVGASLAAAVLILWLAASLFNLFP